MSHDYQTIEQIQSWIQEPNNQKIINDFQSGCNLDPLLLYNESLKQNILKNFAVNITRIFDDIAKFQFNLNLRTQLEFYKEDQRLVRILRSISPLYDKVLLSQIEGNFSFLKKENIKGLIKRTQDQMDRNRQANNQIYDLALLVEKFFKQYEAEHKQYILLDELQEVATEVLTTEVPTTEALQAEVLMEEQIKLEQVWDVDWQNKKVNQIKPQKIIQWEEDGMQQERENKVKSFHRFKFKFYEDRKLSIRFYNDMTERYMNKIVDLCLEIKPTILDVNLKFQFCLYKRIKYCDISPIRRLRHLNSLTNLIVHLSNNDLTNLSLLKELGGLINLTKLSINLSFNFFQYKRDNNISDLSSLKELTSLIGLTELRIHLWNNDVKDISPIKDLSSLVGLTRLYIDLRFLFLNINKNQLPQGTPQVFDSYSSIKEFFK